MAERGKFIVLEGVDNSGKTTQSNLLREYLESRGRKVIQTREPGGTDLGEELRPIILKDREKILDPVTQTLLFYAARQQFIHEVVLPNIEQGIDVITDRFEASTYVYQGIVQGVDSDFLDILHQRVVIDSGCIPDLYLIIDINAEESYKRDENQNNQNQQFVYEKQGVVFREKIRNGYLQYAKKNATVINGQRSVQAIHEDIIQNLKQDGYFK